ncbi:hypothetical protein ZWY2020_007381 [Hordeum vulgare]|nr:hypothetical protein ZWY2020_007381 [Hordeum vulgare]
MSEPPWKKEGPLPSGLLHGGFQTQRAPSVHAAASAHEDAATAAREPHRHDPGFLWSGREGVRAGSPAQRTGRSSCPATTAPTSRTTWPRDVSTINDYKAHFGLSLYWNLQLAKLKYLAIVVDSREAKNTVKINQLLCWLKTLGVKYVCLYDIDGALKKLFEPGMDGSRDNKPGDYLDVSANTKALGCCQRQMTIECISGSDGKEGIAKAANLLCSTFLNGDSYTQENVKSEENIKSEPVFTETDMANALKSIGCAGPEPDLLLVYGPARCHLGFPTWRLRYTEIMHMGPLKSMKYGALVKAFYNFSKKYQNYGK